MKSVLIGLVLLFVLVPGAVSATDWYARPYRPGGYGTSDGTSYANAFNGIDNVYAINWNAIQPGDSLYVCGFHDGSGYDYSGYQPRPVMFINNRHGTQSQPITVRGDCPGDPGTIFGSGMQYTDGWNLHDSNYNIYSRSYTVLPNNHMTLAQAFERHDSAHITDGIRRLNKPRNTNFASWQPSSYHLNGSILYYKPASGSANDYTFYTGFEYPNINFQGSDYIVVKNINLMSCNNPSFGCNIGIREQAHHITIDNVSTRWAGTSAAIGIGPNNTYIMVNNSTIRDAMSGIYAANIIQHMIISNNEIYDLNQDGYYFKSLTSRGDNHGIALQGGGDDMLIEKNHIHHSGGEGIIWYYDPRLAWSMTNVIIRYNYVHHVMDLSNWTNWTHHNQRGIEVSGHNLSTSTIYNNSIYYNIIHDIGNPADDWNTGNHVGAGIRVKAPPNSIKGNSWSVYNNVVYNANFGFIGMSGLSYTTSIGVVFKNNIIINSRHYNMYLLPVTDYSSTDIDNNVYYPDGPSMFYQNGQASNFQGWQGMTQMDQSSLAANPLFVSPTVNFRLQSGSPAIDNGTDVGLTLDFDGNPIPQGAAPDIGAYEFSSSLPSCTESDWNHSDGSCKPDNTTTRTWTKIGSCEGGITHPSNETVSCVYTQIPGDLNNDGDVDIEDLGIIALHFGKRNTHPLWNATADVMVNNEIDIYDIVFVASRFT